MECQAECSLFISQNFKQATFFLIGDKYNKLALLQDKFACLRGKCEKTIVLFTKLLSAK